MIVLEHEGARMEIAELGAEIRAFRSADGVERIWCGDESIWKGTAPVLFPAIGFLKDGVVTIDGRECAIPKHGFAKYMVFQVTELGDDYVTLTLSENEETKKVYPFDFALSVTHRFLPNGFETRFTVENHTGRSMPFVIGGHPGFTCPMAEGERFTDYVLRFQKEESGKHLLNTPEHYMAEELVADLGEDRRTLKLRYEDFDRLDTYVFAGLNSRSVELIHKDTGKGIRVSFPGMEVLAVWTMPHKQAPYLCIEPWQGLPACVGETGRFEDKPYHVALGVGQTYSCGYRMEII
ncbi:MAG: aldose 1-epimerase family protein [Clostridiales bacterium]|nr:aldose 1-epimerase family protein [Clostridiales bacterium]